LRNAPALDPRSHASAAGPEDAALGDDARWLGTADHDRVATTLLPQIEADVSLDDTGRMMLSGLHGH